MGSGVTGSRAQDPRRGGWVRNGIKRGRGLEGIGRVG